MQALGIALVLLFCGLVSTSSVEQTPTTTSAPVEAVTTSTEKEIQRSNYAVEARGKKKGGMEMMYMMFMMCKSAISSLMSLTQPVFQLKSLGISFVGMLINVARFVMQLKQSQQSSGGSSSGWPASSGGWGGEDRIGRPNLPPIHFRPNYITRYTIHE